MHPRKHYRIGPPTVAYLPKDSPVSLDLLMQALNAAATAERWKSGLRDKRSSYVQRAAEAAIEAKAADPNDLRAAFPLLAQFGAPPDGASTVRKCLAILTGTVVKHTLRACNVDVTKYNLLINAGGDKRATKIRLANLDLLVRASGGGEDSPETMPSAGVLRAAATKIGMPQPTARTAIAEYRRARAVLLKRDPVAARGFGAIEKRHGRDLGIETVPRSVLVPLLTAAGVETDPADMGWEEILRVVAPVLADDFAAWRTNPRRGERGGLTTLTGEYAVARAFNRVVAGLLLAGRAESLKAMTLLQLWQTCEPPFDSSASLSPQALRAREHMGRSSQPVLHQPIRVAMDALASRCKELAGVTEGQYTISTVQVVQRVWTLTAGVYRHLIAAEDPTSWRTIEKDYAITLEAFRLEQSPAAAQRDKPKLLSYITLPHLVCLGLPLLEMLRQKARADWLEAIARARAAGHDPQFTPAVKNAHRDYADAAELRLGPGIYLADGLRLANYRYGILGENYQLVFLRDAEGRAIGIESVRTHWSGEARVRARTKRDVVSRSRQSQGHRQTNQHGKPWWSPVHVPFDALWEYLAEVTLPRIIASGALGADATVEDLVNEKRFPLFASMKSGWAGSEGVVHRAGTELGVEVVGKALWWTAKYALGRELPEWENLDRKRAFFRIFVGHDTRLLLSVYWGRIRRDWAYAAYLTNDREQTLQENYDGEAYAVWEAAAVRGHPWDVPTAFDAWMDGVRKMELKSIDLGELPLPPATVAMLKRWEREERTTRGGLRGKRQRPVGRIRRARPGQRPPTSAAAVQGNVPDASWIVAVPDVSRSSENPTARE